MPVRLHDMAFLGFDHRLEPPTFTTRFHYADARWTPPQAPETPMAVLAFGGVQVWEWQDDVDLFHTPCAAPGQVDALDYFAPTNVFSLATLDTRLVFSASRLDVRLESGEGG